MQLRFSEAAICRLSSRLTRPRVLEKNSFLSYLPPVVIGLVDKKKNFVLSHDNLTPVLGHVVEVVSHLNEHPVTSSGWA